MKTRRKSAITIDWIFLSVFFSIVLIGWLMLYASSYEGPGIWFDFDSTIGRQTIWLGISIIAFLSILAIDWRVWNSLSYPIYFLCVLLLIGVLIFGKEIKGATSWFSLFGFSIQPSEFAKIGTALAVSAFLSKPALSMEHGRNMLIGVALFVVPSFLILLQPDAGTSIIFFAFVIPLFRAGLNASIYIVALALSFIFIGSLLWNPKVMVLIIFLVSYFFLGLEIKNKRASISFILLLSLFVIASYQFINYGIILTILVLSGGYYFYHLFNLGKYRDLILFGSLIVASIFLSFGTQWSFNNLLKPHQQARINVWLKPHLADPKGELYNIIQSKTAIGSGGFSGKGFLNGSMTKLNYVPEQNTDFVFSILGEEQGFLGSFSLILLFTLMLIRISIIAERAMFPYIRYFAYSFAGLLFFHFFINIGMTMGLMPVIGIPLPLISKGGSSLLAFCIMAAMLLKMDLARSRH